jgi:hypothetical protein
MGTRGIEVQSLQRHATVGCPSPPQRIEKAHPVNLHLLVLCRLQDDQTDELVDHGKDRQCLQDTQDGLAVEPIHLHSGLELSQMGFGFPALVGQRGHVGTWIALDVDSRGHDSARLRAKPRRADVGPDVAYDSGRWQCLACLLSEPRRARFGFEPLHQWVMFAVGLDPTRPWQAFDLGRPSGKPCHDFVYVSVHICRPCSASGSPSIPMHGLSCIEASFCRFPT